MEKKISATETVRRFSEVLSSVLYKGIKFRIMRGGKPVAQLAPLQAPSEAKTLGQLKEMLVRLPPLGAEAAEFEDDLRLARTKQPPFPEGEPWV